MKGIQKICLAFPGLAMLSLALCTGGCSSEEPLSRRPAAPDEMPQYAALDGYGQWVGNAEFGRAWSPYASADWAPFSCGHWIWTDRGWMWVGYEPFGWIVYHYGYWAYDPALGWLWVPGNEWSPARVRWRTWDDYVSWAPLPPPGVSTGGQMTEGGDRWTTVPVRSFTRDNVGNYRTREATLGAGGRTPAARPPEIGMIERSTAQRVARIPLETERVRDGGRALERIKLPPSEENRVTSNRPLVEDHYLRRGPGTERRREGTVGGTPNPAPATPAVPPPAERSRTQQAPATPVVPPPPATQQQPSPQPQKPPASRKMPVTPRPARTGGEKQTNDKGKEKKSPGTTTRKPGDQNKGKRGGNDNEGKEAERSGSRRQDAK